MDVYLSCYDFRLGELPIPRSNVYYHLRRLRSSSVAVHTKYLKPLDIDVMVGVRYDRRLAYKLLSIRPRTEELGALGFPEPDFLFGVSAHVDGHVIAVYYQPPGIRIVDERGFFDRFWLAHQYPVQNCLGRREASEEAAEALAGRLNTLQSVGRLSLRMPALAYLILAVLDTKPLASLRDLSLIAEAAKARELIETGLMIKLKYLQRYYRNLSRAFVAGRAVVYPREWRNLVRVTIVAPKHCKKLVYGAASATLVTPHVFIPDIGVDGDVVAHMALPPHELDAIIELFFRLCPDSTTMLRLRSIMFPFPYERFDPIRNRWDVTHHKEFLMAIQRMRVAASQL
ncbi:MAG: hypothetical protein GXO15_00050 [Crenarchaeota archaeon]|nr:hypothetical protein [Thermoproteota archaeon]